jgi:hypothetical protein
MRRHTGQRALYEAWSLSRSKPKRHGLLDRLRPQLERLQAAANAKLKAAMTPRSPEAVVQPASHEPVKAVPSDYSPLRQATVSRVDAPKTEVVATAPAREETPPLVRGQAQLRERGGVSVKTKTKPAKAQAAIRNASRPYVLDAPKAEVQEVKPPKVELAKVEVSVPAVESAPPEISVAGASDRLPLDRAEAIAVEPPEVSAEETQPAPAAVAVPESAKPAQVGTDEYSSLHYEDEPPREVERPISRLEAATGLSAKAGRIVDRLRAYRTQRAEQLELNRDSKPRLATNLRPRMVQVNAGRIEISVPTLYGILVGLALCLLLLVVYQIGHFAGKMKAEQQSGPGGTVQVSRTNPVDSTAVSQGNNMIVVARHSDIRQLDPLKNYFNGNGLKTIVVSFERLRKHMRDHNLSLDGVPKGDGYFLLAYPDSVYGNGLYGNLDTPGTEGYKAKQKIIELGAKYKPEPGFAPFSAESFRGAYGLKMQ